MRAFILFVGIVIAAGTVATYVRSPMVIRVGGIKRAEGGLAESKGAAAILLSDAVESARWKDPMVGDGIRVDPQLAAALKDDDPQALLTALRESGFPEDYVRHIILWQLGAHMPPHRIALARAEAAMPFWQGEPNDELKKLREEVRRLDEAKSETIRAVFGRRLSVNPLQLFSEQRRYVFLPEAKRDAASAIDHDYSEMASELRRASRTAPSTEIRQQLRLLESEHRADLSRILSPAELELHELHLSSTATSVRSQMDAFRPTEQEFRAIFAIRRSFEETHNLATGAERAAAERALRESYRDALGERRFADFERSQNVDYRIALEVVRHFQLPEENATETYTLQRSIEDRLRAARTTHASNPDAFRQVTQALAAEARTTLAQLLGTPGAEAFLKAGGHWMRALERGAPRS